jgi:hypothetical protein
VTPPTAGLLAAAAAGVSACRRVQMSLLLAKTEQELILPAENMKVRQIALADWDE